MRGAHCCTLVIAVHLFMYIDVTLISYINVVYVCDVIRYALRRCEQPFSDCAGMVCDYIR